MTRPKIFVSAKCANELDPINRDDFNIRRGRQPNPTRMEKIKLFADRRREYDYSLTREVREAIKTGHSYRQVAEAAGVSVSVVQRIMKMEQS